MNIMCFDPTTYTLFYTKQFHAFVLCFQKKKVKKKVFHDSFSMFLKINKFFVCFMWEGSQNLAQFDFIDLLHQTYFPLKDIYIVSYLPHICMELS